MIRVDDSVKTLLMRLSRDVNTVLATLTPADLPEQPINWNDLSCNEVVLQWDGVRLVAVATIEEAAPGCTALIDAVLNGLHGRCWPPELVVIRTEW